MMARLSLAFLLTLPLVGACAGGGTTTKKPDAAEEEEEADAEVHADAHPTPDARVFDAKLPDGGAKADSPTGGSPDAKVNSPDAMVAQPDAAVALVDLSPKTANVARTGTVTITVELPSPAGAGGQAVLLDSDDSAVTVPSSVIVPEGEDFVDFEATGVTVASGVVISARIGQNGARAESTIRVVPKIDFVTPSISTIMLGQTGTVTVFLEEAVTGGPLTIDLGLDFTFTIETAATATIANGEDSVDVDVSTLDLGVGDFEARIGNLSETSKVRVQGVFLSEILYDVTGDDDTKEWVELYNATDQDIDLSGYAIDVWVSGEWNFGMILTETIPAGGCVVVGGPDKNGLDFDFLQAEDFDPDLGNAGSAAGDPADGIQLETFQGLVIDNVIYGRNNDDDITDEDGDVPFSTDIGDASPDKTIERVEADINGGWTTDVDPNPGDCSAISK